MSRYQRSLLLRGRNGDTLGLRPLLQIDPNPDDRFHTVTANERIDQIAAKYLGNAKWWWVICDVNDVFNPLELKTGQVLRIPSASTVSLVLDP